MTNEKEISLATIHTKKHLEYLNVYIDGEQVKFIPESELTRAKRERTEEIIKYIETSENNDNDYMRFATGIIVADARSKFLTPPHE